jgi:DNA polymerase III subunit delta
VPVATPAAVRKQILAGTPDSVYLILGEDEVEKSALAHEFEVLVEEGLRAFNVEAIHAGDVTTGDRLASTVSSIVAAARTLPMMAPRRIVIIFQAGGVLMPKRESEAAERALDQLEALVRQPDPQTTLVLVSNSIDKRSRMYKLLSKRSTLVECGAVEDQADAERWVKARVSAAGAEIDPAGARLLAERCGTDVKRLRNDVERLLLYALGQKAVTLDDVRAIVGPAELQNDWAMANAIEGGDLKRALRELALILDSGADAQKVLGQLGWLVRTKFPMTAPLAIEAAVEALFRTDQDLKRSAGEPRILLERLVVELCGGKRARSAGATW